MECMHVNLPGGFNAIVCGRGLKRPRRRCRYCGAPAPFLCDWKLEAPTARNVVTLTTCDFPICARCAFEVAPDKHLCPPHRDAYRRWLVETHLIALT